jgi:hypothetical protein
VALPGSAVPMSMAPSVFSTHSMHVVAATFPYTICCALGLHCPDGLHCSTWAGPSRPGRRYTAACSVRDMVQGCAVWPGCCYMSCLGYLGRGRGCGKSAGHRDLRLETTVTSEGHFPQLRQRLLLLLAAGQPCMASRTQDWSDLRSLELLWRMTVKEGFFLYASL